MGSALTHDRTPALLVALFGEVLPNLGAPTAIGGTVEVGIIVRHQKPPSGGMGGACRAVAML